MTCAYTWLLHSVPSTIPALFCHRTRPLQDAPSGNSSWLMLTGGPGKRLQGGKEGRGGRSPEVALAATGPPHGMPVLRSDTAPGLVYCCPFTSTFQPGRVGWGLSVVVCIWVLSQPLYYLYNQFFPLRYTI